MASENSNNKKPFLASFSSLGIELLEDTGENYIGDCPFCGKENHFYVDPETGQWDCKVCLLRGNFITFMGIFAEMTHAQTHPKDWAKLSTLRGLPVEAFKRWEIGWTGTQWLIPCRSERKTVRDLRRWNYKTIKSTGGCKLQLFGLYDLSRAAPGATVWVCEGEWDAIALKWLLTSIGRMNDVVVGVPGAGVFKNEWVPFFKGKKVILCYDNDVAGDDGSRKAAEFLKGTASTGRYLCWPETLPQGWDVRDHIVQGLNNKTEHREIFDLLERMIKDQHRRDIPIPPKSEEGSEVSTPESPATFQEVVDVFQKWVQMDQDFYDALVISLATCMGIDVTGDPIWIDLVGTPGSGKTVILMALQYSERVVFRSSLTPASLVSGFNAHPDPSLLPHLDGKCAVFKDGTELLALHPDAKREVYSILRGAHDGVVHRSWGNGVTRNYSLKFNMLIGVTPAIQADSQAMMGERFLRFKMRSNRQDNEKKIFAAISNITEEIKMAEELSGICRRYLLNVLSDETLPPIPQPFVDRIVCLTVLLSALRAVVEREGYGDRDMKYRPAAETGTRPGKQLAKLGQLITFVLGKPELDEEVFRLLERITFSSVNDFSYEILKVLMSKFEDGMTRGELEEKLGIPGTTITRHLQDLEQLQVVRRIVPPKDRLAVEPLKTLWKPTSYIVDTWYRAKGGLWRSEGGNGNTEKGLNQNRPLNRQSERFTPEYSGRPNRSPEKRS